MTASTLSAVPQGIDSVGNPFDGTTDPNIMLGNRVEHGTRFPAINANKGSYEGTDGFIGDFVPTQASTRYARVGDVIEFVYGNDTFAAHHPFHMHGFSFQPISVHEFISEDNDGDGIDETGSLGEMLYEFDYNEFVDVIIAQPGTAVKFRMKMNDRFKIPDAAFYTTQGLQLHFPYDKEQPYGGAGDVDVWGIAEMGGAVGRWLFHCHILHHAGLGMISDLCIAPEDDPDASGCKIDIDESITFPTW